MVCDLVFLTVELAVVWALASCLGVKLLPAFLTSKFWVTWKIESLYWGVVLKSCANFLEEHVQLGSVLFRSARRHLGCAFCFVQCQLQPLRWLRDREFQLCPLDLLCSVIFSLLSRCEVLSLKIAETLQAGVLPCWCLILWWVEQCWSSGLGLLLFRRDSGFETSNNSFAVLRSLWNFF